jgi:glycosyltransferase involved in cell wall biosynthesis
VKLAFLTTDNREQFGRYDEPKPFFGTAMSALLQGFEHFPDAIEVHVISCAKREMRKPALIGRNIHFHQPLVPKLGWGRSAFIGCGMAVRKVIEAIDPDLVHAQGTERDCAVSMMLAPRRPKLLTIHGHMARIREITGAKFPSYYWMAANLESLALKRADGIIALTNYTQKRVESKARQTWVIPNAVDESFFKVANDPEKNLILCVAHVTAWKRQTELIHALDLLPKDMIPRLVFLGNGSESLYGKRFADEVSQRPWCHHAGNANRAELREWLSKASFLVLPSIEDNCPMVALEAMASGVPVVASNIGGIPDLVIPGEDGELFDPRDPADIAEKISRVLNDPTRRDSYATRARLKAQQTYHPVAIARKHLEIYADALSKARKSQPATVRE